MTGRDLASYDAVVKHGVHTIGAVVGDRVAGFTAFDEIGRKIGHFATIEAAHRAVYERHRDPHGYAPSAG